MTFQVEESAANACVIKLLSKSISNRRIWAVDVGDIDGWDGGYLGGGLGDFAIGGGRARVKEDIVIALALKTCQSRVDVNN